MAVAPAFQFDLLYGKCQINHDYVINFKHVNYWVAHSLNFIFLALLITELIAFDNIYILSANEQSDHFTKIHGERQYFADDFVF